MNLRSLRFHAAGAGGRGALVRAPLRIPRAAAAAAAVLLAPSAPASAELPSWLDAGRLSGQVVAVRVYKDDRLAAEGAGVLVGGAGDVLTSSAVLDAGPRATVVAPGAGELAAELRLKETDSGLGVLRADGLRGPGLTLSTAALAPGARVFALTPGSADGEGAAAAGAAGEAAVRAVRGGEVRLIRHNAMIAARGYGSPVVDECGRLVALNVPDPEAFTLFTAPRKVEPKGVVFALSAADIVSRLDALGVGAARAADACASAEARAGERAREAAEAAEEARRAEEKAGELEDEARRAAEEAQRAQAATENAREESRQAREAADRARETARQAEEATRQAREEAELARTRARQAEAERQRAREEARRAEERSAAARTREAEERRQAERLRRLGVWGGAAGGALLLVLLVSWAVSARRRRRATRAAEARASDAERDAAEARRRVEEMPGPAPFDCVLTGVDERGTPYALNLRRGALGDPAGAVVGRNPAESSHVVADPSVSREHARLRVEDGELYVEDLGSTNGTVLNGRALVAGERARAGDGDELTLGSVTFRVSLGR